MRARFAWRLAIIIAAVLAGAVPLLAQLPFATFGLSLGIKHALSDRFGLRAEGRAFFVSVGSGGGVFCSGSCLFVFRASGLWQGDLSAGVTLGF